MVEVEVLLIFLIRSPMGDGSGTGLTARTLGQTIGVEAQALTSSNLPTHTHDMSHTHGSFISGSMSANTTHGHGTTESAHSHARAVSTGGGSSQIPADQTASYTYGGGRISDQATTTGLTVNTSANLDHNHTTNITAYSGNTGNGGFSGTASNVVHPSTILRFAIAYI